MKRPLLAAILLLVPGLPAVAQWDPASGAWGKSDPNDVRVMTWNVFDGICSTNAKTEGFNNWHALVTIVAALRPDVLILQECGDNAGNGTGSGVDSPSTLATVVGLFFDGGSDPFLGGSVGSYVQKYAPGYTLPHVFVSTETDGFNRNVVVSRWPFADLNGDGKATYSDIPTVSADAWAPGGDGGIRGFQLAEIDLPDATYAGDLVVGNAHLKASSGSCTGSCAHAQRVAAAQNTGYVVQYWYNGFQIGFPDPAGKIADQPPATMVLADDTPVILGGDWNEGPGPDSPSEWLTLGEFPESLVADGTDRDGSDMLADASAHPLDPGITTTQGNTKLDHQAWQDSIATLRRSFLFDSSFNGNSLTNEPPELLNFSATFPWVTSGWASDHRPVLADYQLPLAAGTPLVYCTAKVNSLGCTPGVSFSGTPGVSQPGPFLFTAQNVLNFRNGLPFYGYNGRSNAPFFGGTLCVAPPLRRLPVQSAGGTPPPALDCSGAYSFDFNALIQGGSDPFLVPGQGVDAQYWTRDPAHPDGTGVGLSNGLEFVVGP